MLPSRRAKTARATSVGDFGAHSNAPVETSKDRAGNLDARDDAGLAGDDASASFGIARHGPSSGQIGFYIYGAEVFSQSQVDELVIRGGGQWSGAVCDHFVSQKKVAGLQSVKNVRKV